MNETRTVNQEYFTWLISQISDPDEEEKEEGYSGLYAILHRSFFFPMLEMDWNRNEEALGLITEWVEGTGRTEDETLDAMNTIFRSRGSGFCTMMELMVVLARRMEYELLGTESEKSAGECFEEMVRNSGMAEFTNDVIQEDPQRTEDDVLDILKTIIIRRFGWDGEGGLFPLRMPRSDQRKEELLNQMNNYIAENYDCC